MSRPTKRAPAHRLELKLSDPWVKHATKVLRELRRTPSPPAAGCRSHKYVVFNAGHLHSMKVELHVHVFARSKRRTGFAILFEDTFIRFTDELATVLQAVVVLGFRLDTAHLGHLCECSKWKATSVRVVPTDPVPPDVVAWLDRHGLEGGDDDIPF